MTLIRTALLVLLLFCVNLTACRSTNIGAEPAAQKSVDIQPSATPERPSQEQPPAPAGFIGTVMARETIDVAAKFEGRLDSIIYGLGDTVAKNAVIATLDPTSVRQELVMAEASLRVARAEEQKAELLLDEAKERHARRVYLAENGIFSKEQLKDTQYQVELAKANLEVASARIAEQMAGIEQLKERLANTEIRSPFEGTVSARHQNPGAVISRGTPIISLIRSGDLWIRFAVPMDRSSDVSTGTAIEIKINGIDSTVPGMIENIAPGVEPALQMLMVEARLKIPEALKKKIRPGMVGSVRNNHKDTKDTKRN